MTHVSNISFLVPSLSSSRKKKPVENETVDTMGAEEELSTY